MGVPARGGPGFPENELAEFLGVHGWGPTIIVAQKGFPDANLRALGVP